MLDGITFTGIDVGHDPMYLRQLHRKYPKIEFAVLVGSPTTRVPARGPKNNRFPSLDWITDNLGGMLSTKGLEFPVAVHFCGRHARKINGTRLAHGDGVDDNEPLGLMRLLGVPEDPGQHASQKVRPLRHRNVCQRPRAQHPDRAGP